MDSRTAARDAGEAAAQERLLTEFARLLRDRYGARIYLFGSRARGTAMPYSDYDLVAVADAFGEQPLVGRCLDRGDLWFRAGGWRKGLDLHCYTPSEFREELAALGYLGQAKARGELIRIRAARRRRTRPAGESAFGSAEQADSGAIS